MLLAIDVGNTRTKFCRLPQGGSMVLKTQAIEDPSSLQDALSFRVSPPAIIGCSVVPRVTPIIEEACQERFGMPVTWLSPSPRLGIEILYQTPETLGMDRFANVLGALELAEPPSVVVDVGTATKLEAITASGAYAGGAILPGLQMGLDALHVHTGLLPKLTPGWMGQYIGRNTIESIQVGAVRGHMHSIVGLVKDFEAVIGKPNAVFLTGGSLSWRLNYGELFSGYRVQKEPDLTMLGLAAAAKRLGLG